MKPLALSFLLLFAQGAVAQSADNDRTSSPDIITLCYATAEVCLDACDKGQMTGAEFSQCKRTCEGALERCRVTARKSSTTRSLGATSRTLSKQP